jgi:hypothetical protein
LTGNIVSTIQTQNAERQRQPPFAGCEPCKAEGSGMLTRSGVLVISLVTASATAALAYGLIAWTLAPDYQVRNNDPKLMDVARTAAPIIDSLNRYQAERGLFPALDDPALSAGLPKDVTVTSRGFRIEGHLPEWLYSLDDRKTLYRPSYKLGWDPRLVFIRSTEGSYWEYDPGDGADATRLILDR